MIDPNSFAPWVSDKAQAMFRAELGTPVMPPEGIPALRAHYDAFNKRHLETARALYPVAIVRDKIAGVAVDIVTPEKGITDDRTLLCLHGGAFMWGRGAGALLEAVPVAATSGMRVIAVEYSLAPEQTFPAAVDDVLAVYMALCRQIPSSSIGIYGCSAGGALTAQAVARLISEHSPLPGAVAMLCGTGINMAGDSMATAATLTGQPEEAGLSSLDALPYFATADVRDALCFPGEHPDVLAQFPPSLLVTGTCDFAASSVATMHRRLVASGTHAELLHFDGMWHAFHMATDLPEARETFAAMARFFDKHLAA
jgi:monoterpene epsilon-lactone hydrolase